MCHICYIVEECHPDLVWPVILTWVKTNAMQWEKKKAEMDGFVKEHIQSCAVNVFVVLTVVLVLVLVAEGLVISGVSADWSLDVLLG